MEISWNFVSPKKWEPWINEWWNTVYCGEIASNKNKSPYKNMKTIVKMLNR